MADCINNRDNAAFYLTYQDASLLRLSNRRAVFEAFFVRESENGSRKVDAVFLDVLLSLLFVPLKSRRRLVGILSLFHELDVQNLPEMPGS